MQRINTPNKAADLFGAGKHGFRDGSLGSGIAATEFQAAWCNNVQEEIANVVEGAGVALDGGARNQLLMALQLAFGSVVGSVRNARMMVAAASATATYTADELVVASALGGMTYRLTAVNKVINLATVGAGGMDTGAAPANGFVAVYAIYNPATGVTALLAVNATSAAVPEVYGGANMPAGYTASALVSVRGTNGSGQFVVSGQLDRRVYVPFVTLLLTTVQQVALTALSISGFAPFNAKTVSGQLVIQLTATGSGAMDVAGSSTGIAGCFFNGYCAAGVNVQAPFADVLLVAPQTLFYIATGGAGTYSILGSAYTF